VRRNFQVEQFFHRQAPAQVIGKRRQVIHAIGQRDRLLIRLLLELLFDAGVQVADIRLALHHRLAVQFDHQPQHSVRGGVLRSHVEDHAARPARNRLLRVFDRDCWR